MLKHGIIIFYVKDSFNRKIKHLKSGNQITIVRFKSYKFKVLKKGFTKKLSKFLRLSTYPAGIGKIGINTGLPNWLKCNMESNVVKIYGTPLKKDIGKTIIQILLKTIRYYRIAKYKMLIFLDIYFY